MNKKQTFVRKVGLLAFGIGLVTAGFGQGQVVEAARMTKAETQNWVQNIGPIRFPEVTRPADGNVFVGVGIEFLKPDKEALLNRINAIRQEAYREGLVDRYVPIKWSKQLEEATMTRAVESSYTMNHLRLNGKTIWTATQPGEPYPSGENLAWNYNGIAQAIEQFYSEKAIFLKTRQVSADTGHYVSMINPSNTYTALSGVYNRSVDFPVTVAQWFSSSAASVDESLVGTYGETLQILEVTQKAIQSANLPDNIQVNINGLHQYQGQWVYLTDGFIDTSYDSLVNYQGQWFKVTKGHVDWSYTGLVDYFGTTYYLQGGKLVWGINGLVQVDGTWYLLENSAVKRGGETLAYYNGTWFYVNNGQVQWGVDTLVNYNGTWYAVRDSKVDWSFTGLVDYYGTTYYIQNGQLNWGMNGLVQVDGTWYLLENSAVKRGGETLAYYNGTWFYVNNGQVQWGVDTLVNYNGTWYAVRGSKVDWSFTGLVDYYGTTYYIQNGKLTWGMNGLVQINGNWYNLSNSALKQEDDIVPYNGQQYYVRTGRLIWGFNGQITLNGKVYNILNSTVQ